MSQNTNTEQSYSTSQRATLNSSQHPCEVANRVIPAVQRERGQARLETQQKMGLQQKLTVLWSGWLHPKKDGVLPSTLSLLLT